MRSALGFPKDASQALASHADQPLRDFNSSHPQSEFLKTVDAAAWLCFTGPDPIKQFFEWANRYHVPRLKRGRTVLWERRVLLDFLRGEKWTRRRV